MQQFLVFTVLILFKINNSSCFNPSDLCRRSDVECFISENEMVCQKVACHSHKGHSCGSKYCAKDLNSCADFKGLEKINGIAMRHLVKQIRSIQKCSTKNLSLNDVCINTFNSCAHSKLTYPCMYYCTRDKNACNHLKNMRHLDRNGHFTDIKNCFYIQKQRRI